MIESNISALIVHIQHHQVYGSWNSPSKFGLYIKKSGTICVSEQEDQKDKMNSILKHTFVNCWALLWILLLFFTKVVLMFDEVVSVTSPASVPKMVISPASLPSLLPP